MLCIFDDGYMLRQALLFGNGSSTTILQERAYVLWSRVRSVDSIDGQEAWITNLLPLFPILCIVDGLVHEASLRRSASLVDWYSRASYPRRSSQDSQWTWLYLCRVRAETRVHPSLSWLTLWMPAPPTIPCPSRLSLQHPSFDSDRAVVKKFQLHQLFVES